MLKPILVTSAAVLISLAVIPKFVGNSVESNIKESVSSINESPVYKANIISYKKGWFHTEADIELSLGFDELLKSQQVDSSEFEDVSSFSTVIHVKADHGILLLGDNIGVGRLRFAIDVKGDELREYLQWNKTTPIYQLAGHLGLLGDVHYKDHIPSLVASEKSLPSTFNFSGYSGVGETQNDGLHYQGLTKSINATYEGLDIAMANLSFNGTFEGNIMSTLAGELNGSQASLAMDSLLVSSIATSEQSVQIKDLNLYSLTDINSSEELADVHQKYTVGSISVADFKADDIVFAYEFNNIDTNSVKALQDFSKTSPNAFTPNDPKAMQGFVEENLLPLLAANPQLNITEFSVRLPEGKFSAHFNSQLVGVTELPNPLNAPAFWIEHAASDMKIIADKPVLEWVATQYMAQQFAADPSTLGMTEEELNAVAAQQALPVINSFVQQGFIAEVDNTYQADVALKNGELNVNGNAIPLQ